MKENYYLDDGTYSASQIVIEMVRSRQDGKADISDLLKQLQEPQDAHEYRLELQVHFCTSLSLPSSPSGFLWLLPRVLAFPRKAVSAFDWSSWTDECLGV